VVLSGPPLTGIVYYRNQMAPNTGRNPERFKNGMSLEVLKELVSADEANQKPIKAGDFDINQFLQQVKQDDLKWGIKQFTDQQIEGTKSYNLSVCLYYPQISNRRDCL
jgi:hypothetical protein